MPDVEIEYCVPCKLLPDAIRVAQDLLVHHGHDLDTVRLKTGSGGVFKIRYDGVLIWDENVESLDVEEVRKSVKGKLEVTT